MRRLRPYGIYRPPGSLRPVYAIPGPDGDFYLYDAEYGPRLPPRFEVKPDGAIETWHGEPVLWRADEMVDTGDTFVQP